MDISADRQRGFSLSNPAHATFALIAITFALRLLGAGAIGWGTGEAYYLSSARQFHLSYFDQPPISLWITWATLKIFGTENILVLRLPFVVLFAGTTWLVYLLGARLHSRLAGFYAALIVNACVLFSLSIGSWMQPDAPMVFFWLATVLVLVEIFFGRGADRPWLYWPLAGLLLGLTFLSKYHAIFLLGGAGLFVLFNRDARRWLFHPAPYVAVLIALVVFSPVIVWNAQNHWASFGFQGGRAVGDGLRWDGLLRMIWGQLLYMVPWLAIPALVIGTKALFKGPHGRYPATARISGMAALLAYIGWPTIIFFTVVALWSDTEFHFHWQAPGYMMLFVILGAWAAEHIGRWVRIWLWGSAAVTLVILTLLVSHAGTGWARQVFPGDWEDPTALQLPWTELGEALEARGTFEAPQTFVVGLGWIDCGYIDTQLEGRVPLACIGPDPRNIAFNVELSALDGWDGVVVSHSTNIDRAISQLATYFESVTHVDTVAITRNGTAELDDIQIYEARGFRFDGPVEGVSGLEANLRQLPRSTITSVAGVITNTGEAQTVEVEVDGQVVGAVGMAGDSQTAFEFDVQSRWSVGSRIVPLVLSGAEDPDAVSLTSLEITRR